MAGVTAEVLSSEATHLLEVLNPPPTPNFLGPALSFYPLTVVQAFRAHTSHGQLVAE